MSISSGFLFFRVSPSPPPGLLFLFFLPLFSHTDISMGKGYLSQSASPPPPSVLNSHFCAHIYKSTATETSAWQCSREKLRSIQQWYVPQLIVPSFKIG